MARVHNETLRVRAAVDAAKASATTLCSAERLADAKEARNEECSALVRLMGSAHLGEHEQSGAYILCSLSVVALWRLRRVSRSFRRWGTEALAAMRCMSCAAYTLAGWHEAAKLGIVRRRDALTVKARAGRSARAATGGGALFPNRVV